MTEFYGLTPAQRDALRIIAELTETDGVPPTYDDLARELGLRSKSGAHAIVTHLVERGWLDRLPHRERSLVLRRDPPALRIDYDSACLTYDGYLAIGAQPSSEAPSGA